MAACARSMPGVRSTAVLWSRRPCCAAPQACARLKPSLASAAASCSRWSRASRNAPLRPLPSTHFSDRIGAPGISAKSDAVTQIVLTSLLVCWAGQQHPHLKSRVLF